MSAVGSFIQSAVGAIAHWVGLRTVVFEVTQECNQDCVFCYNVWKCGQYPRGLLGTPRTIELLDTIISAYRPQVISFSGGEPLLRSDLVELIIHTSKRANCNLITNGTLMTDDLARDLVRAGVRTFEFTLLSANADTHDSLVRRDSFDQLIEAIASTRAAGGAIVTTFVATKQNIGDWEETLELNAALGVSGILFNRFNVGGAGIERASDLMPSVSEIRDALTIAEEGAQRYGIGISCGVPIPPCVLDISQYKHVHFGHCSVGTRRAYPTVDPLGNVRPCNHSPTILGNVFDSGVAEILCGDAARDYSTGTPDECRGCKHVRACRGGCRAAAEVCGNRCAVDPFVRICADRKERQSCVTSI